MLTAGTRFDQEKAKEGKPIPSTVVTLLVTPEDAERISLAANEGQIMLTLRNPLDVATDDDRRADGEPAGRPGAASTREERRRTARRVRARTRPAPAPRPRPKIYTVEAIRAAKRTEESVK